MQMPVQGQSMLQAQLRGTQDVVGLVVAIV